MSRRSFGWATALPPNEDPSVHKPREVHQNRRVETIGLSCCGNLVRNRSAFGAGLASDRRFNGQVRR
jgi:hypothetical protein